MFGLSRVITPVGSVGFLIMCNLCVRTHGSHVSSVNGFTVTSYRLSHEWLAVTASLAYLHVLCYRFFSQNSPCKGKKYDCSVVLYTRLGGILFWCWYGVVLLVCVCVVVYVCDCVCVCCRVRMTVCGVW